jgi:iron complex transport system substrate-binding protein
VERPASDRSEKRLGAFAEAPVYAELPAVRAGQVGGFDDKMPFTYAQYAAWLTEVNAVLSEAKAVTG